MAKEIKVLDKTSLSPSICLIVGTRPGIVMLSPVIKSLSSHKVDSFIIHTGQHYSPNMDSEFFADLELPLPDYRIEGVSDFRTHGGQTARMMIGIEEILLDKKPSLVLVGGDANTNLAGALAARKLNIDVGHIEAGERSFDWRMPEEHNRRIIDHISNILFTTNDKGANQLRRESVQGKIFAVGNPIVDACLQNQEIAELKSRILDEYGLGKNAYGVMTTHREENVDNQHNLESAIRGVARFAEQKNIPVVFPVHPRTEKRLNEFGLLDWAQNLKNILLIPAKGYLDFLQLIVNARIVFTDSGGVQQESCIVKTPCVTLRDNTEWTETIEIGANRLSGTNPDRILKCADEALQSSREWGTPFGDGEAATKIVELSAEYINQLN